MLALKRARPRLALFAAMFGVVFLLAALSVGLSGFLDASATSGARAGVGALTGSSGAFRITIPLATNASAQDTRVREEISRTLRSDGQAVPISVARDVETLQPIELDGTREVVRSALASIPDLAKRADIVKGRWPVNSSQASIQADAAASLGVRLGDRFSLPDGARVTVVATWRVHDASDPIWLGGGIPLSGLGYGGVAGFVVIDPALWAHSGIAAVARWTIVPIATRVTASQLATLQAAPDTVPSALLADPRNGTSIDQDGRLQPALAPLVGNVQAANAVSIAPLVIVAVLGLVTLVALARMLMQLRDTETTLLRARGITRQRLVLNAAVEGAIVVIPATALGGGVAVSALPVLYRAAPIPPLGWIAASVAALTAIVVLAAAAGLASPDAAVKTAARGEKVRSTVWIAAISLTVLAAIVAMSQFVQYGSPLTRTATGQIGVDPVAVTAPALGLAALSLIGLALFPLVSRVGERSASRRVGLDALPIYQLARRNRAAVTPLLLCAIAIAGLAFSSTYSGTWQASAAATRAVEVGTGVRITGLSGLQNFERHAVPGARASAPSASADVQVGDSLVTMVELPEDRLAKVVASVPNAIDPATLVRALRNPVAQPRLPAGAHGLTMTFVTKPASSAPTAADVTVVDATGTLTTLHGFPNHGGFTAQLPEGTAPWLVRAIDVQFSRASEGAHVSVAVRAIGSDTDIALGTTWALSGLGVGHPGFATLKGPGPGIRMTTPSEGARVRLQPVPDHGVRLPIVISASLAKSAGLHVGSTLDLPVAASGGDLAAIVTGVVPVIPGLSVDDGVLADLGAVQDAVLRDGLNNQAPSEWWIAANNPAVVSHWVATRVPVGAAIETRDAVPAAEVLASANTIVWIAAIAIALLGMLAVAAGLAAEVRARDDEVSLLRALGVTGRAQARGRVVEIGLLLGLGLLAGLVDGVIVSALIVPALARTAVPGALEALPTVLSVDVLAGASALLAVLLATAGILLAIAVAVRGRARAGGAGESRQ